MSELDKEVIKQLTDIEDTLIAVGKKMFDLVTTMKKYCEKRENE